MEGALRIEPNNSVLNPPVDMKYAHRETTFHRRKKTIDPVVPKNFSQDLDSTIKLGFALEEARNESKSRLRNLVESVTGKKMQ